MNLEDFLKWVPPGATALSVYFIIKLINNFESFKKTATAKFSKFVDAFFNVRETLIKIKSENKEDRMNLEIQLNKNTFQLEATQKKLEELSAISTNTAAQMELSRDRLDVFEQYSKKAVQIFDAVLKRQGLQARDIESVKIELGKTLVMIKEVKK